ncbi:MAG TPA: NADH-quinone oxidoreductase subunit J [Armatimonadota bacterium]|jgi:NADH-quinone oxidoreductase subunit J
MTIVLYLSMALAIFATVMVITRQNAVHALLYLIASLLAVAVVFFLLGAHFVAALEVIIYAGAIMVLFVFVIMMLNLGHPATQQEKHWHQPRMWLGPGLIGLILLGEFLYVVSQPGAGLTGLTPITPQAVGMALYGPYVLGVELASFLLLAGLIGAFHLGRGEDASLRAEEKS